MSPRQIHDFLKRIGGARLQHKFTFGLLKILHGTIQTGFKDVQVAITIPISNCKVGTNLLPRADAVERVVRSQAEMELSVELPVIVSDSILAKDTKSRKVEVFALMNGAF